MCSREGRFLCKPLACVSLAGPDLISLVQTLSPTDAASMHNGRGPLCAKCSGPDLMLLFLSQTPSAPSRPQLYTHLHLEKDAERSSPPMCSSAPLPYFFSPSRGRLCVSPEPENHRHSQVLFHHQAKKI